MSSTSDTTSDTKPSKAVKKESPAVKGIAINVMGREFRVAAAEGEERQLIASVDLLNKKMKEIKDTGKVVGNERIAIMAALNIALEHLQAQSSAAGRASEKANGATEKNHHISVDEDFVKRKMLEMETMIEKAITDQEKLF